MFVGQSDPSGGICGEREITEAGSVITSPNHPNNYGNEQECDWIVTFPEGQAVSLNFLAFGLERNSRCRYDWLEVRNGGDEDAQMIGERRCGSNIPQPIISSGNQIFIRFHSDFSITSTGFEIEVNEGKCD